MAAPDYFPPALATPPDLSRGDPRLRAFASRSKIAGLRHPPLTLRPYAALRVLGRAGRRLVIATKAAMGAADPPKGLYP